MAMPTFLVLGVAKAGTTSLYHYLQQHPQIYMSPQKEPHFFAYGEAPFPAFTGPGSARAKSLKAATLAAYQALYADWQDELVAGEVSTTNFMPRACLRIERYLPQARLILILRQPAERAYSQFLHMRRDGLEPLADFAQALTAEEKRIREQWLPALCYAQPSFYTPLLRQFLAAFPPEQLRIYLYEEWQTQPARVMREIFAFLGVDEQFVPDLQQRYNTAALPRSLILARLLRRANPLWQLLHPRLPTALRQQMRQRVTTYMQVKPPPLDPHLRAQLTTLYHDDIRELQTLLGRDLTHWLS
ncbi:MAG: sulfotransferase [Caldilineaceae bacterium]|nr:sulfotransferase [Caldilineaceae bacterium]